MAKRGADFTIRHPALNARHPKKGAEIGRMWEGEEEGRKDIGMREKERKREKEEKREIKLAQQNKRRQKQNYWKPSGRQKE